MAAHIAAVSAAHLFMFGVAWHMLRLTLGEPVAQVDAPDAEAVPDVV